jgi:hypothetical protein
VGERDELAGRPRPARWNAAGGYSEEGHAVRGAPRAGPTAPDDFTRSDERILEHVCALLGDAEIDARRIEVRVTNGEVTLEGMVDDDVARRAAEHVVGEARGVTSVHDLLGTRAIGARASPAAHGDRRTRRRRA